jgi:hypothetical protein
VVEFAGPYVDNLLLPGVGHWTEQEAPTEMNRLVLDSWAARTGKLQSIEDCAWKHHKASWRCNSHQWPVAVGVTNRAAMPSCVPQAEMSLALGRKLDRIVSSLRDSAVG